MGFRWQNKASGIPSDDQPEETRDDESKDGMNGCTSGTQIAYRYRSREHTAKEISQTKASRTASREVKD